MKISSVIAAFFRPRTWKLGLKSLVLHPMRSGLTVLGIFFGVVSVIWLLAIGEGISREAQARIEDLGAENVIVRSVCLLYTSPSPRDQRGSRMPSSA